MNTTFENAHEHHQRRQERNRRLAELEAAYDAAVSGNTRAFHQRMEAAENHLLDQKRHGDVILRNDDGGDGSSAWLGSGHPPSSSNGGGYHYHGPLGRVAFYVKSKGLNVVLTVMMAVAILGIVAAFATPSKSSINNNTSTEPTVNVGIDFIPDRAPAAQSRSDYFKSIILGSKVSSVDDLLDEESPQGRAFEWLLDNDSISLYGRDRYEPGLAVDGDAVDNHESTAVLIRYSLAVLYYSTTSAVGKESFDFEETVVSEQPSEDRAWNRNNNWLSSTSVCEWYGITCFGQYDEIGNPLYTSAINDATGFGIVAGPVLISLNVTANGLSGQVPSELFTGLGSCLHVLDLSSNDLSGEIPYDIGHATSLTKLYLDSNPRLGGSIPRTMGTLSHLQYLFLNGCMLSDTIPSELGHLTRLRGLGLHENDLEGIVPASLGNLRDLYVLYLDVNELTGVVPDLSGLTNLADLRLRDNKLGGHLPKLPGRLELAYMDNNVFSGTIHASYGDLPYLTELHLYENRIQGTLPESLGNLDDLSILYLDHNQLSSSIPPSFARLTDLESLYLFENDFTGIIDPIMSMTDLKHLRLSKNAFSGTLDSDLGSLFKLEDLFLDSNSFRGKIPSTLGELYQLENLRLDGNLLSGKVPGSVCNLTSDVLQNFVTDCATEVECRCCTQCV